MPTEEAANLAEFSRLAEARSKIYGFLSLIYIQSPKYDFVKKILDKNFYSYLTAFQSSVQIPREIRDGLRVVKNFIRKSEDKAMKELHESLSVEHTRLFRGIRPLYGPPPPYESVYRDEEGVIMGKSTVEVAREYAKAGVGLPNQYKGEPPDHISFEFDFMRFLCEKEAKAWRNNDRRHALRYLDMEREFLDIHIMKWVLRFCNVIEDAARVGIYRGIAKVTKGFITFDYNQINTLINMTCDKDLKMDTVKA